jgi:hypothetical protein
MGISLLFTLSGVYSIQFIYFNSINPYWLSKPTDIECHMYAVVVKHRKVTLHLLAHVDHAMH